MTMFGISWGLQLAGISPLAKLVAIRLGDGCDQIARGRAHLDDLIEWCCASSEAEIYDALRELALQHDIAWADHPDRTLTYSLPYQARPERRAPREEVDPRGWIYVIRGRIGRKIGITGNLANRVYGLRAATADSSLTLEWNAEAGMSVVRKAERIAHAALAAKLIRNEWFDISIEEAIVAVQAAVDQAASILVDRGASE